MKPRNIYRFGRLNGNWGNLVLTNFIGFYFFELGFTPCKTEQPLQCMELQIKEDAKKWKIQRGEPEDKRCLLYMDLKVESATFLRA